MTALVKSLQQDVERFRLLYQRDDLAALAKPHLERMQAGVGAARIFLRDNKNRVALEDSLRLLGSGSVKLMEVLKKFDEVAQQDVRFHPLRFLEELGRAGQLSGPKWLFERVWLGLEQALAYYRRELVQIRHNPLFFEIEGYHQATHFPFEIALQIVVEADKTRVGSDALARLQGPVEQLDQAFGQLKGALHYSTICFLEAPNLNSVRELVGRTLNGEVSASEFARRLQQIQHGHGEMLKSLEAGAVDELVEELAQLTRSHTLAYARMAFYADDGDPEHLRQGWRLIALTLPRVISLSKELREKMGVQGAAKKEFVVSCPRCGTENHKGQKFCAKCNALLPQAAEEAKQYTDIIGAPPQAAAPAGAPANITKLEELSQLAELGKITRSQFQTEMDEQLTNADKIRQAFERQVQNLGGKSKTFDAYADFFATQMGRYIQGLQQMRSYSEGANIEVMRQGFLLCQAAGRELVGFQGHVQEALRGRR